MGTNDERARDDFILALLDKITIAKSQIDGGKTKLDPEIKAKWLEALRSGKYEQGKGCLRDHEGKYCCLGVLADIVDPEGWGRPVIDLFEFEIEEDEMAIYDPDAWYGRAATICRQDILNEMIQVGLYEMNDSGLFTFEDIANIIEEYL